MRPTLFTLVASLPMAMAAHGLLAVDLTAAARTTPSIAPEHQRGFDLGDIGSALQLVIDPTLAWNTFLGGTASDVGNGVARDPEGNTYVTGWSAAS